MINTMIAYAADITGGSGGGCPTAGNLKDLTDVINFASCTLANSVIPLLIGLAVVAFVYGIIKYFLNPDNEEKKKQGKSYMLWGIIALFVMVSFWGLVGILAGTFGGSNNVYMPSLPENR